MKFIKHVWHTSFKTYAIALVLFMGLWHAASVFFYIKSNIHFISTSLNNESFLIEEYLKKHEYYNIHNKLRQYTANNDLSLEFHAISAFDNMNVTTGMTLPSGSFRYTTSINVVNNGLLLGRADLIYNLNELNKMIFKGNIVLYVLFFVTLFTLMLITNYPSFVLFNSLRSSVDTIERNLDLNDVGQSLKFISDEISNVTMGKNKSEIELILKLQKILLKQQQLDDHQKEVRLIGSISRKLAHDIMSPLSFLKVMAKRPALVHENEKSFSMAISRIEFICNELLSKTKKNRAPVIEASQPVSDVKIKNHKIRDLINKIILEKKYEYLDEGISISVHSELPENAFIRVEEFEFYNIFSNLINNSIQARRPGYPLKLNVQIENINGTLRIHVKDNGRGIPFEHLESIFKKDVSIGKQNGNGIGLFHAREKIEQWGGHIFALPNTLEGAHVVIELPLIQSKPYMLDLL